MPNAKLRCIVFGSVAILADASQHPMSVDNTRAPP
jgi:hypothetical protein